MYELVSELDVGRTIYSLFFNFSLLLAACRSSIQFQTQQGTGAAGGTSAVISSVEKASSSPDSSSPASTPTPSPSDSPSTGSSVTATPTPTPTPSSGGASATPPPPNAPTDLAATTNADGVSLALTWTDQTNGQAHTHIERFIPGTGFTEVAAVNQGINAYSDPSLTTGQTYYYRARSITSSGTSAYSAVIADAPYSGPLGPFNIVGPVPNSSVNSTPRIIWAPSDGATAYDLVITSDAGCTTPVQTLANQTLTSASPTALAPGTYYACVTAKDGGGHTLVAADQGYAFTVLPPPGPIVLGQPDPSSQASNNGGLSAQSLAWPDGVQYDGTHLFVVDTGNDRVLMWNTMPTASNQAADIVVGQPDFGSNSSGNTATTMYAPEGVFSDGHHLFVADSGNHRVLIWNNLPTVNQQPADVEVGQVDMNSRAGPGPNGTMGYVYSVYYDGTHLFAADQYRVLIWNSLPTVNGQAPDVELGQPDINTFTSNTGGISNISMASYPEQIFSDGTRLFLADENNNRILVWNSIPTLNDTPADLVLGQATMGTGLVNTDPITGNESASTLEYPFGVCFDGHRLYVADSSNNRLLVWNNMPTTNGQAADIVLGQPDMLTANWPAASATTFSYPTGIYCDASRLYVADESNNRVIIYPATQVTASGLDLSMGPAPDTTSPIAGASGTLTASTASATSVTLTWAQATDDQSSAAHLKYLAFVSLADDIVTADDALQNGTLVGTVTGTGSFTATGLTTNTPYWFNVVAVDEFGNRAAYHPAQATPTSDTNAPIFGASGAIALSSVSSTGLTLTWTKASDDHTPTAGLTYFVYQSQSNNIDTLAHIQANGGTPLNGAGGSLDINTLPVTGLIQNVTYYFNVVAKDAAGNQVAYTTTSQTTPIDLYPGASGTVTPSAIAPASLTLSWSKATDTNAAQGTLTYLIYQSTSNNIDTVAHVLANGGTPINGVSGSTDINTYNVSGLAPTTTYYFAVVVKDPAGNLAMYNSTTATTLSYDYLVASGSSATSTERTSQRKTFYDAIHQRYWAFYQADNAIGYSYSSDGKTWTSAGTLPYATSSFAVSYKAVSGVPYVYLATEANTNNIALRRGALGASSVSFGAEVTVFTGTSAADRYQKPSVALDASGYVWVAASYVNSTSTYVAFQAKARRSVNAGDGDLSTWQAVTALGSVGPYITDVAILPRTGAAMYLLTNSGSSLIGYAFDGTSWSAANTGGTGSWFRLPVDGFGGQVSAITISGSDVYVGGGFTHVNANPDANYIVRWDGTTWTNLGTSVNDEVKAIAVSGSDVYVGGNFTSAGGNSNFKYVARWDGVAWHSLGSGPDALVRAIAVSGADVYVGGDFTSAGGVANTGNLARWDGSAWHAVGTGLNGSVKAIATTVSDVYVGGEFTGAGGVADYIGRWDGSTWHALGSGVNGWVGAIAINGTDVYAGGAFGASGADTNCSHVARWDGTTWHALASGVDDLVYAITVNGTDVYIGGTFGPPTGLPNASRVLRWDGSAWNSLGGDTSQLGMVYALAVKAGVVYMGGSFSYANFSANYTQNLATWDGTTWAPLATGLTGGIKAITMYAGDVYVGGNFLHAGNLMNANYIARWDGTAWHALGSGLNNQVDTIVVKGTDIYVGGSFTNAGGISGANYMARWDGSAWNAVGSTLACCEIMSIAFSGSNMYVGGIFTHAGGLANANYLAMWDGSAWNSLGTGVDSIVESIAIDSGGKIYVGGAFLSAGGVAGTKSIAYWDGSAWHALGSGLNVNPGSGEVHSVIASGTDIYAAGNFYAVEGDATKKYVAHWDGSAWHAIGGGVLDLYTSSPNQAYFVAVSGSDVYVGGDIKVHSGVYDVNGLARFDGTSWYAVGPDIGASPDGLYVSGSNIYIGNWNGGLSQYVPAISAGSPNGLSAVSDSAGDVHLAYYDISQNLTYNSFSSSWNPPTVLSYTASSNPNISIDPGTNNLYATWFDSSALKYKHYVSASTTWDTNPTTVIPTGTRSWLNAAFDNEGGSLNLIWTDTSTPSTPQVRGRLLP